ncbi:hypothetical protein [Pararhizobium sp.]|uniref:hypothetical protein n=1 Tax=Pararhizobium sp. TaxID=1977563 RepID=UPI0027227E64|nr:hypothetical protein [Pararhizobium sp.]MDO9417029.1 hypothetical protein [Pararhizobium sp.]
MTTITSKHEGVLHVPGGPSINPFTSVEISNWDVIKHGDIAKSWLSAGVIVEEPAPVVPTVAKPSTPKSAKAED